MNITYDEYRRFIKKLTAIDSTVSVDVANFVAKSGGFVGTDMDDLINYCYALVTKYGNASGVWAAEFYDAVAALSGVNVAPAVPAETASYKEVAKTVSVVTSTSDNIEKLAAAVSRYTKLAAQDTILNNAIRDGAQVAWIPRGDTCAFCLALASRGWQYASDDMVKNGHAEHIHGNCDCSYGVRFDNKSTYRGYNPDKYKRIYQNADGYTSKDKINSMRRDFYQENREKILEQKRDNYARSKALEASSAEEMDVD